ncbi:polyprenyl synthetase family protein [Pseudactinotalea sp. Z1748]|uniref:polyprenyl synthetase family protein n=1 Tax=Pseudactinotalea sp. Z1748 TaxID=3413027 RepID=UPI003C7D29D4
MTTAPPSPHDDPAATLSWLRQQVSTELTSALQHRRSGTAHIGPETAEAFEVAERLAAGGKRLRAAFAYLGWTGYADTPDPAHVLRAGVGLELFHLAALVHDDVIDASHQRRGQPAAHRQFARHHELAQMISDPEDFGTAAAILLGDLLVAMAGGELSAAAAPLPAQAGARVRDLVTEMMSEVTMGQYLDIYAQSAAWSTDPEQDLERAHRVVRSKSARYSVEHPMLLGAAIAGAGPEDLSTTRAIGLPIGEAFQMRDDLLGVFGDPEVTGKPSSDDLREGKRTVLITTALTLAEPDQADRIRRSLGGPISEDDITDIRRILTSCGAVDAVESLITARAEQALTAIQQSGWPSPARDLAQHLAEAAITRST